jgi:hypothetical protein
MTTLINIRTDNCEAARIPHAAVNGPKLKRLTKASL